jgi:hypothetical protein
VTVSDDEIDARQREPSSSWLTAALAEHAAIRGEVVAALSAQHAVFSYGVAAVGLLTAVAVGATSGEPQQGGNAQMLAATILLGLNPVLLVAVLFLWSSEVLRMQRAGAYLFALESVINGRIGKPEALAWEGLVNPPGHAERVFPHVDKMQRWAISVALTAITVGSVASGVFLDDPGKGRFLLGTLVSLVTTYFGLLVWAFFDGNRRWLRKLYDQTRDESRADSTPPSVRTWAEHLEDDSWRRHVHWPLNHLPGARKRKSDREAVVRIRRVGRDRPTTIDLTASKASPFEEKRVSERRTAVDRRQS